MRNIIITIISIICLNTVNAKEFNEFTDESDLRPYLLWLSQNTRFKQAHLISKTEVPEIILVESYQYRIIDPMLKTWGVYYIPTNTVYINKEDTLGRPDVIIHELVHFLQIKFGPVLTKQEYEFEAKKIQLEFIKFNQ